MTNHWSSDDRKLTVKLQFFVSSVKNSLTISICFNISKITMMPYLHSWASMGYTFRIPVRSSRLASLYEISKLMHVKAMQAWSESADFSLDLDLLSLNLFKLSPAADSWATIGVQNAHGVVDFSFDYILLVHLIHFIEIFSLRKELIAFENVTFYKFLVIRALTWLNREHYYSDESFLLWPCSKQIHISR